jgi:mRNA interferase MazF
MLLFPRTRQAGSMLTSGDVIDLDLGSPKGHEAGLRRPVVVVTAQEILDESGNVVQVVPLTSTIRPFGSEVQIESDETNGLESDSAAQCQHIRSVSLDRVESVRGNVGAAALSEIREVLGLILDIG